MTDSTEQNHSTILFALILSANLPTENRRVAQYFENRLEKPKGTSRTHAAESENEAKQTQNPKTPTTDRTHTSESTSATPKVI